MTVPTTANLCSKTVYAVIQVKQEATIIYYWPSAGKYFVFILKNKLISTQKYKFDDTEMY